jgi:hypothetical protein
MNVRHAIQLTSSVVMALIAVTLWGVPTVARADEGIRGFIESNCLDCHSGKDSEAGFDLESLAR